MASTVEDSNEKHLTPWSEACERDGIHTTPLSPYLDQVGSLRRLEKKCKNQWNIYYYRDSTSSFDRALDHGAGGRGFDFRNRTKN